MASDVEICNRALQRLGSKRIVSLSEDSVAARACNVAYTVIRDAELRAHPWSFAVKRATLAADATSPDWGKANAFTLPSDFLRLLPTYPERNGLFIDHEIESGKILTNDSAPLYIRYIYRVTDPNQMDVLFRESLAVKLAFELCEELTQSNTKKDGLSVDYKSAIREAKRTNAIEKIADQPPEDEWVTVRS